MFLVDLTRIELYRFDIEYEDNIQQQLDEVCECHQLSAASHTIWMVRHGHRCSHYMLECLNACGGFL